MGRRAKFAYYYLRRSALIAVVIWAGMHFVRYAGNYYDANIKTAAQNTILPSIITVDAKGVSDFLKQPNQVTLIFIYSSRSMLSRWYFDNFNKMAAKYTPKGVRILFISVDGDINSLANFLATQGQLYFTPLYMLPSDQDKWMDGVGQLGGDPFGGALPYMGIMNQQKFLRDFSQGILRTGKIDEAIQLTLNGG